MKITKYYSPNFDFKERSSRSITAIIIHYTGMQSERESLKRLTNPKKKVSCHYLINRKGTIFRLVKEHNVALHAGKSMWGKYKNLNKNSIGIELENRGHKFGYQTYTKKQLKKLTGLCKNLKRKYKIKNKHILGNSDIAPLRKIDPGEKFPWKFLAGKKIGTWHNCKSNLLTKYRKITSLEKKDKIKFVKNLNKIGYCSSPKKKAFSSKIIKAFQRHYRQELINGHVDKECSIIAQNLLKNV